MSSSVEFDEDSFGSSSRPRVANPVGSVPNYAYQSPVGMNSNEPKMVRFLMNHGLVKSPESAQKLLIGLAILNFIVTLAVIKFFLF